MDEYVENIMQPKCFIYLYDYVIYLDYWDNQPCTGCKQKCTIQYFCNQNTEAIPLYYITYES